MLGLSSSAGVPRIFTTAMFAETSNKPMKSFSFVTQLFFITQLLLDFC